MLLLPRVTHNILSLLLKKLRGMEVFHDMFVMMAQKRLAVSKAMSVFQGVDIVREIREYLCPALYIMNWFRI